MQLSYLILCMYIPPLSTNRFQAEKEAQPTDESCRADVTVTVELKDPSRSIAGIILCNNVCAAKMDEGISFSSPV